MHLIVYSRLVYSIDVKYMYNNNNERLHRNLNNFTVNLPLDFLKSSIFSELQSVFSVLRIQENFRKTT